MSTRRLASRALSRLLAVALSAGLSILLAGCGFLPKEKAVPEPTLPEPPTTTSAVSYPVKRGDIAEAVEGTAEVTSVRSVALYFKEPGLADQSSGNRHALLLSAAQFLRAVVCPPGQPHAFQAPKRPCLRFPGATASDPKRKVHVLTRGQARHERKRLEHETDLPAVEPGQLALRQASEVPASEPDPALRWRVQPAHEVEERGLARPGLPLDQHQGPRLDREADPVHGADALSNTRKDAR